MTFAKPIRPSGRPGKQLLWLWFGEDLRRLGSVRSVIDAACGEMFFRKLFENASYTGIDINADRLKSGVARYPDARSVCSPIDEIDQDLHAELVICLQAIGMNSRFEKHRIVATVESLVRMTSPKGTLIFNAELSGQQEATVDSLLSKEFAVVRKRRYGDLPMGLKLPLTLSFLCAALMRHSALIRGNRRSYYHCSMRRDA